MLLMSVVLFTSQGVGVSCSTKKGTVRNPTIACGLGDPKKYLVSEIFLLKLYLKRGENPKKHLPQSSKGKTSAFQVEDAGSIPVCGSNIPASQRPMCDDPQRWRRRLATQQGFI